MMRCFLLCLVFILAAFPARADNEPDFTSFSKIPVQHEGRIKPLDTFARLYLKSFSGKESLDGLSPEQWLAETLFDPGQALLRPTFRIFRPEVIGLAPNEDKLYSFAEINEALQQKSNVIEQLLKTDQKNWTEDQKDLIALQEHSILYMQLLRSFSLILPLQIEIPDSLFKEWKLANVPLTLQQLEKYQRRLDQKLAAIMRKKGSNPDRYTQNEKQIAAFAYQIQTVKDAANFNVLFRVIPSAWEKNGEWFSPWALTQQGKGSPEAADILGLWEETARAYLAKDASFFEQATGKLAAAYDAHISPQKIGLEIAYNTYHPLIIAMAFYLLSFLAIAFSRMGWAGPFYKTSWFLLGGASLFHALTIAGRILILNRPPVGTLYESILFVSLICVLIAMLMEKNRKDGTGLLIGSITGMLLLFISHAFAGDDTLKMLVAVLNTNFWLGTHVLCITIGYGLCMITACLAHLYLYRAARGKDGADFLPSIRMMGLLGLLFTAVGTILGGIWADQSWGRFWGWDPKENGALLIVLWLIWLYHGQLSGHLKRSSFVAGLAALNIVVALAWFGVNLLNVGLHSYGFITGVAAALGAFCAGEMIVIGFLWWRAHQYKSVAA